MRRVLPLESIQKLEVARGRRSFWKEGAIIGFVPGALFFGATGRILRLHGRARL